MAPKTIYDIAKESGVSIATVSRVMNDSPEISEKTRKKVLRVADKMGYYPQANAQGLARRENNRIVILVPVISNYFFMEVLDGIQDELANKDYELNIINVKYDKLGLFSQIETIIKRHIADGYILISAHLQDKQLHKLLKYDTPLCLVDETFEQIDSVTANNKSGIQKAVNHFITSGCKRIAFISASKSAKPSLQRINAYQKALKTVGRTVDPSLIVTGDAMNRDGFTEQNGYQAMQKLLALPNQPDACVCASDIQAIGAQKALREAGSSLPVIGYDDITISEYIGLSTVRQPMHAMGRHATKKLLNRMHDPSVQPSQQTFQPELILRESSRIK